MESSDCKIFGICGREGAGKSTSANLLSNGSGEFMYEYTETNDILEFLINTWFTFNSNSSQFGEQRDVIWNFTRNEIRKKLTDIFDEYLGNWKREIYRIPINFKRDSTEGWYVSGLADLLKIGCCGLFNIDLRILMGEDPISRKEREICTTLRYTSEKITLINKNEDTKGIMTGRQCLQYAANEMIKCNFDIKFWNKILNEKLKVQIAKGNKIIIPDTRFNDDIHNVWDMGGTILMVYKHPADLLLSEADKKTHSSCWEFLVILAENKDKRVIYIQNDKSVDKLKKKLFNYTNRIC